MANTVILTAGIDQYFRSLHQHRRSQILDRLSILIEKLETVEVVSLELPMNQHREKDRGWLRSAGIFKTDPQFEEFQQEIQAYRDELDSLNS